MAKILTRYSSVAKESETDNINTDRLELYDDFYYPACRQGRRGRYGSRLKSGKNVARPPQDNFDQINYRANLTSQLKGKVIMVFKAVLFY